MFNIFKRITNLESDASEHLQDHETRIKNLERRTLRNQQDIDATIEILNSVLKTTSTLLESISKLLPVVKIKNK